MLKLKQIKKVYKTGSGDVEALKGIDLEFRKNEFVAILGQSGCGKTTMLNIIGGLDKYTSGDLFINGTSTKEFGDRDWDTYRNHSIGFIFQSYNLIPHQTVLGNVELALTIAGVSKEERTRRAKEALDKVGLEGKYDKKPNQLSGGQCQRVAIARALVNEPDILLADEPTGALDTATSVQIMELVKEIAKERLVIMVTHNPELAEQYANRTIRLLDGEILSDSNPYVTKDGETPKVAMASDEKKNSKKTKMSFFTAFKLSLQNLFTKKARTIMTAIAGSIGIIGVSAVLSVSNGVKTYVSDMQNDMLSGNPITISEKTMDLSAIMSGMNMTERAKVARKADLIGVDSMIDYLVERATSFEGFWVENTIDQKYVDYVKSMPKSNGSLVDLDYGIDITNNIYTDFTQPMMVSGTKTQQTNNMSLHTIKDIYTNILRTKPALTQYASLVTSLSETFMQAPNDEEYIRSQYKILNGKVATAENEIMIVASKDSALTDLLLAQLGIYTQDEFLNLVYKALGDVYDSNSIQKYFDYATLMGKTFTYHSNDVVFSPNANPSSIEAPFTYNAYEKDITSNSDSRTLTIVGILEPKEDIAYGCLESGFYYTEALTNHILETSADSDIVRYLTNAESSKDAEGNLLNPSDIYFERGVNQISYSYSFYFEGNQYPLTSALNSTNPLATMMGGTSTQGVNLRNIGGASVPNTINIYSKDFTAKDKVLAYLDAWNDESAVIYDIDGNEILFADRQEITYADNLSVIMNMINGFINIITIALIAFTALSLVVSCVMIAIITYVSVVERVKEIGVIRSLGGRKKDVSHLFNAETFIIGLASGIIGVTFTYILSALINLVVGNLSDIGTIAIFPVSYAIIMVCISVALNLISGFFPSKSAAKKDPVVALRTE